MPLTFTDTERNAAAALIELALAEDLANAGDLTCAALIDADERAEVNVVVRKGGILSGLPVAMMLFARLDRRVTGVAHIIDGSPVMPGDVVATFSGPLRSLLTGERTALNFLTHLSGIASLTLRFVDKIAGTPARILDTRKTTPGWRALEKYAVRCGGGTNHRMGLYDGVLIKDNHLADWTDRGNSIAEAVRHARRHAPAGLPIEVEVDTLDQFRDALEGPPDIVLLDNMPPATLRQAVALRDETARGILLEASGGVTLENVADIARTGVDRISVGALTHSAVALDIAFDWKSRLP